MADMGERLEVSDSMAAGMLVPSKEQQTLSSRQALAAMCHSLTGCSSLNVMCDLRTRSVYCCGILASKLQQHGIIKELVDRYVLTHTLQCNSCHDCTAYKQVLYCYICDCACF